MSRGGLMEADFGGFGLEKLVIVLFQWVNVQWKNMPVTTATVPRVAVRIADEAFTLLSGSSSADSLLQRVERISHNMK